MNFKNIATITGLATGAAIAFTAMPSQAATFGTNGGVTGTFLGHECDSCVDLDSAGFTVTEGLVGTPPSSSAAKVPGVETNTNGTANDTSSLGVTSFTYATDAPHTSGDVDVVVEGLTGEFEFFWGSVDTYNFVEFWKGGSAITDAIFSGTELGEFFGLGDNPQNGNYGVDALVKFTGDFDQVILSSTRRSFEVAAAPAVPEPASILGLALVGLVGGSAVKRRSQTA
jgi:hypothetical protein